MNLENIKSDNYNFPVLLNGLLGDFLGIECFIHPNDKKKIDCVYYLGINPEIFKSIYSLCKVSFPNLKKFTTFWDNSYSFEYKKKHRDSLRKEVVSLTRCKDYSVKRVIYENPLKIYYGSTFLNKKLANVTPPTKKFAFIHSYSKSKSFTKKEWDNCIKYLNNKGIQGVAFGNKNIFVPEGIINYSKKTSILEAIEFLKKSKMYIGISSCFSVLAVKILHPLDVKIRTKNANVFKGLPKFMFYAPHKSFPFLYLDNLDFKPNFIPL